jgi:small subunit ribosomal protein S6
MPEEAPLYDLMLLLSNDAEEERRERIVADVRQAISSGGGSITHDDDWGARPLAYRIAHQVDAEYHLLQFTGPPALLESLGHTLRITDGVLRFRIIKVLPGTPGPPKPEPAVTAASSRAEPTAAGSSPRVASAESPARADPEPGTATEPGAAPRAGTAFEAEAGSEAAAGSGPGTASDAAADSEPQDSE